MAHEIIFLFFELISRPDCSSFTGIPIAGSILSIYGSYTGLIWFNAVSFIGAALFFVAARVMVVGWSLNTIF